MVGVLEINLDYQSYDEIKIFNSRYIRNIYRIYNDITQDEEYTPDYNYVICNKCCYDISYIQSRSHQEIKGGSYKGLLDEYWHCPHHKVFFSHEVSSPQYRTIGNGPSWYDVMMDEEKIKKDIKKAKKLALKEADEKAKKEADEKAKKSAKKGGKMEPEQISSTAVMSSVVEDDDSSDDEVGSILRKFENTINDPRYKKEEDMKRYFNNQIDKKRSAGKKWIKEVEKPCKYALRAFAEESIATYKFVNPKTGKKDKLRYAECWQWECTGPISGKVYDLHICNCVHPGEKDEKGRLIWLDDWLCDPKFVFVYDRLEDWYKWDYSFTDMRWIYNAEKENCPLMNRKKGLVPGSGEVACGFSKTVASDSAKGGRDSGRGSPTSFLKDGSRDGRGSPTSATVMANVWSRNSRLANVVDDDGWSTPLVKNK